MILPSASPLAWLVTAAAVLAYAVAAALVWRGDAAARRLTVAPAWALHALALALGLLGRPALFGFAPALSMTAWLALTTYAVEHQLLPQMRTRWALPAIALLCAATVLAAAVFPGRALPATASGWLALHLMLGLACYGLFAAAVVHAWLMGRAEARMRQAAQSPAGLPLLTLERLTFRFVQAGFILLSATLVEGFVFGEQLYGHAWHWDHKSVFSVLSWVVFAVLLLGRSRLGWRGRSASRVLYAGATLLLLAYVGSRFVSEIILRG